MLAEQIGSGRLRPGQRLGAERALAAEFGVSRATLRRALAVLEEGGVVRRVPGRGGGTSWCGSGSRTAARSPSSTPGSRPGASPGCSSASRTVPGRARVVELRAQAAR